MTRPERQRAHPSRNHHNHARSCHVAAGPTRLENKQAAPVAGRLIAHHHLAPFALWQVVELSRAALNSRGWHLLECALELVVCRIVRAARVFISRKLISRLEQLQQLDPLA